MLGRKPHIITKETLIYTKCTFGLAVTFYSLDIHRLVMPAMLVVRMSLVLIASGLRPSTLTSRKIKKLKENNNIRIKIKGLNRRKKKYILERCFHHVKN